MGLIDGVENKVEQWIFGIAVKRVTAALVGFVIGQISSGKISATLASFGVVVDPNTFSAELTGALTAGSVALHDWLRVKTGWKWL